MRPRKAPGHWYCAEKKRARQRAQYAANRERLTARANELQATVEYRVKRRRRDLGKQRGRVLEQLCQLREEANRLVES